MKGAAELKGDGLERLVLTSGPLTAQVLPELGGKISSLRRDGIELLQQPLRPYALRTPDMGFDESDASGFDECLPSVAACEVGAVRVPDHGEFWRLQCEVEPRGTNELKLTATGSVLPLRLERTLKLNDESLRIDYRLENVGEVEVPWVWSAHPLFCVDPGDAVVLPGAVNRITVEGSAHGRLGLKGTMHSWPVAEVNSGRFDLSGAGQPSDGIAEKIFAASPQEGWMAIERRSAGIRVQVSFDPNVLPYSGLWLCYGGWPELQAVRQQCVALEPCTAPGDSLAEALETGSARMLASGHVSTWRMSIAVTAML